RPGPVTALAAGDLASRARALGGRPASPRADPACAKTILSTLARRAYRRPIDTEIDTLLGFYDSGRRKGTFDTGIEHALRFMLTSPKFLFRDEPDPANVPAGAVYPVTDLELASRLSFFLWSSVPDDQLITVAAQGRLRAPAVFDRQARR